MYENIELALVACNEDDVRWLYGVPPKGNANFAWAQHFIHQRNNKENQYVV